MKILLALLVLLIFPTSVAADNFAPGQSLKISFYCDTVYAVEDFLRPDNKDMSDVPCWYLSVRNPVIVKKMVETFLTGEGTFEIYELITPIGLLYSYSKVREIET